MKKIGILFILITTLLGLNIYSNNVKAEDTNHTLTIKKETKDNKQGEFTYRVKVWKGTVAYDYNETVYELHMYHEVSDGYYFWSIDAYNIETREHVDIKYNDVVVSDKLLRTHNPTIPKPGRPEWSTNYGGFEYNWNPFTEAFLYGAYEIMPFLKTFIYYYDENRILHNNQTYDMTDIGEIINVDGVNYPLIVSGSAGSSYHEYTIHIPKITKKGENYDLSSQLGNPVEENTYEFKLNQGEQKQISIPEGYQYEVIEMPKENWQLENINEDSSLTKAEGTMTSDKEYTFKNKKLTYDVLIHHYKENTTEKLGEDEKILDKQNGYNYTTSPITNIPEGYELKGTPGNANGTINNSDVEVIYEYKLKDVNLTIKHLDEQGNPLVNCIIEEHKYGDNYTTERSTNIPDNYEYVRVEGQPSGTITQNTTVTYIYKKKAEPENPIGQITVRYVDEEGKEIDEAVTSSKEVGNTYTSIAKEIEGYVLKTKPETESYTYAEQEQIVTYVYSKIKLKVETKVKGSGGTIEGNEEVLYGNDSTKDKIIIKADTNYYIDKVWINGKEIEVPNNSEKLTISNFIKMNENKTVEVSFKNKPKEPVKQVVNVPKTSASSIIAVIIGFIGLIIALLIYYFKLSDKAINKIK